MSWSAASPLASPYKASPGLAAAALSSDMRAEVERRLQAVHTERVQALSKKLKDGLDARLQV